MGHHAPGVTTTRMPRLLLLAASAAAELSRIPPPLASQQSRSQPPTFRHAALEVDSAARPLPDRSLTCQTLERTAVALGCSARAGGRDSPSLEARAPPPLRASASDLGRLPPWREPEDASVTCRRLCEGTLLPLAAEDGVHSSQQKDGVHSSQQDGVHSSQQDGVHSSQQKDGVHSGLLSSHAGFARGATPEEQGGSAGPSVAEAEAPDASTADATASATVGAAATGRGEQNLWSPPTRSPLSGRCEVRYLGKNPAPLPPELCPEAGLCDTLTVVAVPER